jgi:hypothetical protein
LKYRNKEMRKLYEVEVYLGDPDKKSTKTEVLTVVAWNEVDALRRLGGHKAATQPKFVDFVSWDEPPRVIRDTAGPTEEVVEADFGLEDGDF